MSEYLIQPFCRKKVNDAYFLLLKKRKNGVSSVIQINEIGNFIISLLENNIKISSIFNEISNAY